MSTPIPANEALAALHLETLLSCAPFGFAFFDLNLRFLRVNELLAEMNGLPAAAHLGKTVAEILPTLEATLREATARILATGQPVLNHEVSGETARAPGVTRYWNASWYPVRGEHGKISGFSAVVEDITERKQADAALRANTALFSKIIEQAPGGVYVVDAQFRVAQMNAESLPFFASAQPLIGRDFDEALGIVWGPEIGPQIASIFRHTLATGERYVSPRFSELRQDIGVEQAFEWETQRITLPDGQHGVVCYFMDVTERERAVAARRESDERLRLAIAGSDLGTWHWDISNGELDWSQRCLQIFGFPEGTVMSYEKFLGAVHPQDRARVDEAVQRALQDSSEYRIECRNVWPDGSLHWAISLGRVYCDATGKPIRMEGIALDTTERKRAETELRLINERLTLAVKCSQVVVFQMDLELRYTWILNSAPGWEDSQCIGKRNADIVDLAGDAAVYDALKREVIRTGVGQKADIAVRLQGALRHFDLMVEPLRNAAGHVTGITGASIEITARKQAQESQRLLASIVENARDFIGIADAQGNPIYGNRAAMKLVGIKDQEQVRSSKIVDYFVAEQRQFVEEVVLPAAATDGRWAGELTMHHFDTGATIPVWYDLYRVDDLVTGQPVNYATITRDLTVLKKTEEALQEKAHFLQRIADVTPGVLHVYDLAQRRAVFINRSITDLLDYSPEEVLAMGTDATPSLMHTEDFPRFEEYMARVCALADGEVAHFEFRMHDRGGAWHWLLSHGSVFSRDATGAALQTIGVASEITERKEIELDLIEATAAAEKANRAKSDFLSSMSHELRTPLNAILGFAQLLESGVPVPTPLQKHNLDHIIRSGWYLLELVNEVLDLAQIESGNLSLVHEHFSLAEVILECMTMMEPQARARAITLTFPSVGFPCDAFADRMRIKQIAINLLSNAIKYNKMQGAVTVELGLSSPDTIRVSVRDTGEGLAPEKIAQLFQPFNRLGKETGPEQGTGIGLVMSKRLVELMGGGIGVESTVGVGSVFWFELKWTSAERHA